MVKKIILDTCFIRIYFKQLRNGKEERKTVDYYNN